MEKQLFAFTANTPLKKDTGVFESFGRLFFRVLLEKRHVATVRYGCKLSVLLTFHINSTLNWRHGI